MIWRISDRFDPVALPMADRHYNRQKVGSPQFVPPGRCVVLLADGPALWVTSWPRAEYTHHAWAGAWVNSLFRREGGPLASEMIRAAVAATRAVFGDPPPLGMITFVDAGRVRHKRDPGRCYLRAGFRPAACPWHDADERDDDCAACSGRTKERGLLAFQLLPCDMPEASQPIGWQPPLPWGDVDAIDRVSMTPTAGVGR